MGAGSLAKIVEELKSFGSQKPLIITDPGLTQTDIISTLETTLSESNFDFYRFDKVEADPRYQLVTEVVSLAKEKGSDCIIGIGGGSSLDIAKMVSVMATNPGSVADYFGIDLVPHSGMKCILIPTTSGTGSEVTPIVILSDHEEKLKKGVVSNHLFPDCAILDPELTLGLPPAITAATGMDALIHALEAFTSVNATPTTDMFAVRAMQLIIANIRTAYANGLDVTARLNMLEGSMLAGMAFANAGVTAVHAFAYPIGAEFHIPHGVANTIMLAPVMEFNLIGNIEKFAQVAQLFGQGDATTSRRQLASLGVEAVKELAQDLDVPRHLSDFGVRDDNIPNLAAGVMKVTRLLGNNPRKMTLDAAQSIYRNAL